MRRWASFIEDDDEAGSARHLDVTSMAVSSAFFRFGDPIHVVSEIRTMSDVPNVLSSIACQSYLPVEWTVVSHLDREESRIFARAVELNYGRPVSVVSGVSEARAALQTSADMIAFLRPMTQWEVGHLESLADSEEELPVARSAEIFLGDGYSFSRPPKKRRQMFSGDLLACALWPKEMVRRYERVSNRAADLMAKDALQSCWKGVMGDTGHYTVRRMVRK